MRRSVAPLHAAPPRRFAAPTQGLQKQNPVWAHSGAPVPPSRPSQLETAAARCRSRSIRVARQGPAAHLLHSVRISREEDQ
ncbi:unnamed protein product [Gadus morhua 'NCC']